MALNQEPALKEFLKKEHIRTMGKDLKRLREADALKEREKIKQIKIPDAIEKNVILEQKADAWIKKEFPKEQKPKNPTAAATDRVVDKKVEPPQSVQKPTAPVEPKKVIPQIPAQPDPYAELKKYANEEEKQQIFLLQSQKTDLEKQLQEIANGKKPSLTSKKDDLLAQKSRGQKKLGDLEQEQKTAPQDQKELVEKKQWSAQRELANLEKELIEQDSNERQLDQQKSTLSESIAKTDQHIKAIYSAIKERKTKAQATPLPQQKPEPQKPAYTPPVQAKKEEYQNPQKGYLEEVSPKVQEKLGALQQQEEKQRLKFMEEVEKWANSNMPKE